MTLPRELCVGVATSLSPHGPPDSRWKSAYSGSSVCQLDWDVICLPWKDSGEGHGCSPGPSTGQVRGKDRSARSFSKIHPAAVGYPLLPGGIIMACWSPVMTPAATIPPVWEESLLWLC